MRSLKKIKNDWHSFDQLASLILESSSMSNACMHACMQGFVDGIGNQDGTCLKIHQNLYLINRECRRDCV